MNPRLRRQRTVLRLRARQKKFGSLTTREEEILAETRLFRVLKLFYPNIPDWQVRWACRRMQDVVR